MLPLLLNVPDITCDHCVAAITECVSSVPGVDTVDVDLALRTVSVTGRPDHAAVAAAIDDAGYTVEG